MAWLDWSQCPVVESIPGKVSGAWVFRGTRRPVAAAIAGKLVEAGQVHLRPIARNGSENRRQSR